MFSHPLERSVPFALKTPQRASGSAVIIEQAENGQSRRRP